MPTFVDYPLLSPVLDDHSEWPYTLIKFDISLHHAGVFQRHMIIQVQITVEIKVRIPDLDNRYRFGVHTFDVLHAI